MRIRATVWIKAQWLKLGLGFGSGLRSGAVVQKSG